jgi:hypothetical protein
MVIGKLDSYEAFPWSCPRCRDASLKGSLWTYTSDLQKKIEARTSIVLTQNSMQPSLLKIKHAHMAIRPFMIPGNDKSEPNEYYRPWLEEHVGKQGRDWDWDLCGTEIDYLEIYFARKEQATLFELKWP